MKKLMIVLVPMLLLFTGCQDNPAETTDINAQPMNPRGMERGRNFGGPREMTEARKAQLKENGFTEEEIKQMEAGNMTEALRTKLRESGGFGRPGGFRDGPREFTEVRIAELKDAGFTDEEIQQLQNGEMTDELREKMRENGGFGSRPGGLRRPDEISEAPTEE